MEQTTILIKGKALWHRATCEILSGDKGVCQIDRVRQRATQLGLGLGLGLPGGLPWYNEILQVVLSRISLIRIS